MLEDYLENEGVCSGSVGEFYQWPVSSTPCTVSNSSDETLIKKGLCRPETEKSLLQQQCIADVFSLPQDVVRNIRTLIESLCRTEIYDNFDSLPFPDCAKDCINTLTESGTAVYENPVVCLSDCPTTVTPDVKTISSPNFPNNYPNGVYLYYVLIAPEQTIFNISFKFFDIEDDLRCLEDWVIVLNADGSELLPTYCGSQKPESIRTQTNLAILVFYSDVTITRGGFQAEVSDGVSLGKLSKHTLKKYL